MVSLRTSVILVLHGEARMVVRCLQALAVQDDRPGEVVLVASRTTPPPGLPDVDLPIQTVEVPRWSGPHAARNAGVETASGDLLVFIDADCVPGPAWLARLVGPLRRGEADLVGGAVACGDLRWTDRGAHRAKFGTWAPFSTPSDRSSYPTANLAVRRATWDRVGPFRVPGWSGDTEFVWRARASGARTAFVPDAIVTHHQRVTVRGLWRERYDRGRAFAEVRRAAGGGGGAPWMRVAGAALVPFVLVGRSLRVAAGAGALREAVSTVPVQLFAQAAWVAGETAVIVGRAQRRSRRHPPGRPPRRRG